MWLLRKPRPFAFQVFSLPVMSPPHFKGLDLAYMLTFGPG